MISLSLLFGFEPPLRLRWVVLRRRLLSLPLPLRVFFLRRKRERERERGREHTLCSQREHLKTIHFLLRSVNRSRETRVRVCVCVNTRVVYVDFFFEASASLISSSLKKIDPLGLVLLLLLLSLSSFVSPLFVWVANFFFPF